MMMKRISATLIALASTPAFAAGPVIWGPSNVATNLQLGLYTHSLQITDGSGYIDFFRDGSTPATPATNTLRLYSPSSGFLAWLTASGGGVTFAPASAATSVSMTVPNVSGTLTLLTASQVLTNKTINCSNNTCSNVDIATAVSGLGTGIATWLGTPSSANLISAVTDETGTGSLVFGTAPTITLANGTGLPLTTGVTGILPLANGGTNKNLTPAAGGLVYMDSDSLEPGAAGTSGQIAISSGTGAPTWLSYKNTTDDNTFLGDSAGAALLSGGTENSFFGDEAGKAVTTGDQNTAVGSQAGMGPTTGGDNTAVGFQACIGFAGTSGSTCVGSGTSVGSGTLADLVAIGHSATATGAIGSVAVGASSKALNFDVSLGYQAGTALTHSAGSEGYFNTLIGYQAGAGVTSGASNTFIGSSTGGAITSGSANTAIGASLNAGTTTASSNVFIGYNLGNNASGAGVAVTTAGFSTLIGSQADLATATATDVVYIGYNGAGGTRSVVIGSNAADNGTDNVFIGEHSGFNLPTATGTVAVGQGTAQTLSSGVNNTLLGNDADVSTGTFTNSTALGNGATVDASNAALIGNASVTDFSLGDTASAAASSARTLRSGDANGSDKAGGDFTIQASRSTGSGAAGKVLIKGAPAASTSSTLNTVQTMLTADPGTTTIGTTVTVKGQSNQTADMFVVEANDGTDSLIVNGDDEASGANVAIRGTATNDAAATGFVGQLVEVSNTGTGQKLTSLATTNNISSAGIQPGGGDWDMSLICCFAVNGATIGTALTNCSIETTSATIAGSIGLGRVQSPTIPTATADFCLSVPPWRVSLASGATTTYYGVAQSAVTVTGASGGVIVYGRLSARRVR